MAALEHPDHNDVNPPITDSNALVWTENYVEFNLFAGLHKFRWKQNGAYYNIYGFEISYVQPIPVNDCEDVFKYGLDIDGDVNEDCYVNMDDLADFVEDWAKCNDPCNPLCTIEEP